MIWFYIRAVFAKRNNKPDLDLLLSCDEFPSYPLMYFSAGTPIQGSQSVILDPPSMIDWDTYHLSAKYKGVILQQGLTTHIQRNGMVSVK
jgi:hypothetical protein